ncbi:ABC transporter substrate-binding protein [Solidesulfovibrio sp.]
MNKKAALLLMVLAAALSAFWWSGGFEAPRRVPVIGVIQFTANNRDTVEGFKEEMAAAGFIEGQSVLYLIPEPATSATDLETKLAALLARNPDLILASPTLAAQAAKAATAQSRIPVIFAPVNDPVSADVVTNLQQPEANLTGVRLAPSEGRRLQALLELAPQAKKVFVPYNPAEASARESLRQIEAAARALDVELAVVPIGPAPDFGINRALVPDGSGALFMPREGLVMSRFQEFRAVAEALHIPMSTPRLEQVEQGVLTGYGFIGRDIGRQAARMARQALAGIKPSGIPVETARDSLFINLDAADRIGLTIPDAFLRQARQGVVVRPGKPAP